MPLTGLVMTDCPRQKQYPEQHYQYAELLSADRLAEASLERCAPNLGNTDLPAFRAAFLSQSQESNSCLESRSTVALRRQRHAQARRAQQASPHATTARASHFHSEHCTHSGVQDTAQRPRGAAGEKRKARLRRSPGIL